MRELRRRESAMRTIASCQCLHGLWPACGLDQRCGQRRISAEVQMHIAGQKIPAMKSLQLIASGERILEPIRGRHRVARTYARAMKAMPAHRRPLLAQQTV